MSCRQTERGLLAGAFDVNELTLVSRAVREFSYCGKDRNGFNSLNANDTLENKVLRGDSAGLVKATHVDSAGERNAERLSTEDRCIAVSADIQRNSPATYRVLTRPPRTR